MRFLDKARLLLLGLAGFAIAPVACDAGGIVGGRCRTGATACGDGCVVLATDRENCGECGNVCDGGLVCDDGECTLPDPAGGTSGGGGTSGEAGSAADGGTDDPGGARGGRGGSSARGGRDSGGAGPRAGAGGEAGALCLPPFDIPEQCGDCETSCAEPAPLCAPNVDGGYECVPLCELPLVACGDQCVDLNLHPLHCGECNNVCPSGICQAGECVGATTGHVALYCLNYAAVRPQTAHAVLLANAVLLPLRNEVRVLAFTRWAPAASRSGVDNAIRAAASARGRTRVVTNVSDPAEVIAQLNIQSYDVFLVYEQANAPAGDLELLGANFRNSMVLESFARAGGVVVVLEGGQGTGEMSKFISAAGLLEIDGHRPIAIDDTTTRFYNRAPGDVLGVNVISPLSSIPYSCTFETSVAPSADTVFVITDADRPDVGAPAVLHKIFSP